MGGSNGGEGGGEPFSPNIVSYSNYTAEQCFSLYPESSQVTCSSQHLNIYEPPSEWDYGHYNSLWTPVTCMLYNVTLGDRVDLESTWFVSIFPLAGGSIVVPPIK